MADRVFCVDFGSAFTKIALRRDPTAGSVLLACAGADVDYWVPTVVAVDRRGTEPRLEFGDRAADLKSGGGIDVYTDFKKHLFAGTVLAPEKPVLTPLDALLRSDELATLAAKYSVSGAQVAALQTIAGASRALAAPGERPVSLEAHRQANAAKVAYHYFAWLRKQVLAACAKLDAPGLKFEDFPVRVAVPALLPGDEFSQHPGCKMLREALHRAGWPLHPERPFVPEPESNAIGILTKGANVLTPRRAEINLGEMLKKGPLNTVVKGDPNYPSYRALVIDVGAFSTDLASLTVETGGTSFVFSANDNFKITQVSVPVGVSDLDTRVLTALPEPKREWLDKATRKEIATFQRSAYADGNGLRPPGLGMVIGGEADRSAVQPCIEDFAKRVADEVMKFCAGLAPAKMQELILTGGGCSIPAVRDALIAAAKAGGNEFVKTHAPDLKRGKPGGPLVDNLDEQFTRGGSALGGASIYFEKSYY